MAVLPASIALTNIADGSNIVAADHRNNYASIQAAVNALIAITSNGNGTDGDAMVWDGVNAKWVPASTLAATRPRAPRVVTSTFAGGPPASPLDQDIWIATGVDANNTRWQFQYNAGSASASKWEFIGGPPLTQEDTTVAVLNTLTQVGATGFWYTGNMAYTAARAGDYEVWGWMGADPNGTITSLIGRPFNNAALVGQPMNTDMSRGAAGGFEHVAAGARVATVTATQKIGLALSSGATGTTKTAATELFVLPVRIA